MLAIIIPAYKSKYLSETLQSLVNQTNKNFNLYIGNDASPENLKDIVAKFAHTISISYTAFDQNIGAANLVLQWQRCVALSKEEEWIWLFSDDDLADADCVENFYKVLQEEKKVDVYRFNTVVIDGEGNYLKTPPLGPAFESSEEMAYNLLLGKRGNSMPDHIFSRDVYVKTGGFVFTEYAQSADWATSIKFSKEKGIVVIDGAKVHWRYSGINISSGANTIKAKTIRGYLTFITWATQHFQYLKQNAKPVSYDDMLHSLSVNCRLLFMNHYKGIPFRLMPAVLMVMVRHLHKGVYESLRLIYRINKSQAKGSAVSRFKTILGL